MDRSGHFIPGTADTINIGSTTAEVGTVYVGSGGVYFGTGQAGRIYDDGTYLRLVRA